MRYLLLAIPFLFGFTYPVDLDARYVSLNTNTLEVSKIRHWPRADGMEITGLSPDVRILKVTEDARPDYDPATHKILRVQVVDVTAEEYRQEWDIVPLSQEELDRITEQDELTAEQAQALAVYQNLRNGVGTNAQRILRVERVLAHLLRVHYRP